MIYIPASVCRICLLNIVIMRYKLTHPPIIPRSVLQISHVTSQSAGRSREASSPHND